MVQIASGKHLRAILKGLSSVETYAIVANNAGRTNEMTAIVATNEFLAETGVSRTVTVDTRMGTSRRSARSS